MIRAVQRCRPEEGAHARTTSLLRPGAGSAVNKELHNLNPGTPNNGVVKRAPPDLQAAGVLVRLCDTSLRLVVLVGVGGSLTHLV